MIDLGDFSTAGIAVTDDGDLLLVQGNGHPGEAVWISAADGREIRRAPLGAVRNASAVAYRDGAVAIADADGAAVIRTTEDVLAGGDRTLAGEPVPVPSIPTDLGFASDGLWVASVTGRLVTRIGRSATEPGGTTFELPADPVTVLTDPVAPGALIVTANGAIYLAAADRNELALVAGTAVPTTTALRSGAHVWLIGGEPGGPDGVVLVPLGR